MQRYRLIENIILPFFISCTIFLFIRGPNNYIFGQDSMPFFGLFSFYQNPLFSFNNGIETAYSSVLMKFILDIFSNVIISQRLMIFLGTYISGIGFFDLLDVLSFMPNKFPRLLSKTFGLMLFLYNPFTLSVTWAHISAWSTLLLISPFIISFLTETVFKGGNLKRFCLTSLLTIVFVSGLMGGNYPFFLLTVGIYLAFPLYFIARNPKEKSNVVMMLKRVTYIVLFVCISTLWAFLPDFFVTFISSAGTAYSKSFLLKFIISESQSTNLPNVLSLIGYSWIYGVPNAYPWIYYLNAIRTSAYLLLFFLPLIFTVMRKIKTFLPITIVAAFAVIFSTGSNFPFGILNERLLFMKGPFLFLVNAYYFVLQFYVLFISLLISVILYLIIPRNEHKIQNYKISHYNFKWINIMIRRYIKRIIVISLAFFLLSTFFYPFFNDQVYQSKGTNIDEININNGLLSLENYLKKNYSSPYYNTLLIPTSSGKATYFCYNNNSTFEDSTGLISTVDPYPLIREDNSYLASSIENYLSSDNFRNIIGVLDFLHIKYIILTYNYSKVKLTIGVA